MFSFIYYRYPEFTSEENIQGFRGDVVRGKSTERLKSYVQRAISFKATNGTFKEGVTILNIDCLTELCPSLLDEKVPQFKGSEIVFLDLPKVRGFMLVF